MKLAFTTLGCPNWDIDTIVSKAVEYGYHGIDFRGYLEEMDIYKSPAFSTNIEETKQKFQEASLEIPCFSSSIKLMTTSEDEIESHLEELRQYAQLCKAFNAPYIRIFGGAIGDVTREEALHIAVDNLQKMLEIAKGYEVTLLIETHNDWTNCEHIAALLQEVNSDYLQVLWDIHHPYRTENEQPERTWEILGDRIKHTHWKDSYLTDKTDRGYQYCLTGEGDLPLKQMFQLVQEQEYDGYFTLEWEKRWWPNIEEPEIAFKQYVEYMNELAHKYVK